MPQPGGRPDAVRRRDPRRDPRTSAASSFAPDELAYLRGWRFFKSDFVDLLGLFQLDERFIHVDRIAGSDREIDITIRGPWLHTILFEVPVLAIVVRGLRPQHAPGRRSRPKGGAGSPRRSTRINAVADPEFRIADYGTRRRFSRDWHEEVLRTLAAGIGPKFVGTSNVKFAQQPWA